MLNAVVSANQASLWMVGDAGTIAAAGTGGSQSGDHQRIEIKRSKHPDGISSPFKTRLANPKKICSWLNATEVNIDPQTGNVIM